jgi:hypothetical protein
MLIRQLGRRWGPWHGKFDEVYTETEAKEAYKNGLQHGAYIEKDNAPYAVIQFGINNFVAVTFLDQYKREWLVYLFGTYKEEGKMLFLSACRYFNYDKVGPKVESKTAELYEFKVNGDFEVTIRNNQTGEQKSGSRKGVDVSDHWEPYPEFGKYDSLLRFERGALTKLRS